MEILYVFPEPLPLPRARGIQVVHTVVALAAEGLHVRLAHVPAPKHGDPFAAYGLSRPAGIDTLPISRRLPFPLSLLPVKSNRLFLRRLVRYLRGSQKSGLAPELIMARHLKAASALLKAFPDIPLLYEAHEVFSDVAPARKRERVYAMESRVLRHAKTIVAISGRVAHDLLSRYGLKREIQVLHDGVALPPTVPDKAWHEAGRHIVYAGSFFDWKGVDDLVAAAAGLPGCRITLIGGDAEHVQRLQRQAPKNGAEIHFTGYLPHARVAESLETSCIAVLPNRNHPNSQWTSPLKLFEYMAAGCAIVTTDLPSLREILGPDDAVWVRPDDPLALAAGIHALADDPEKAKTLGVRARARAQNYTWEARARRLAEIMRGALQTP
ncbi:MAG: glycosyltransferase family 4 protein [Gammaproteobacteria bacterium]|nr:glycosyltransferase family 4 protein [Gammaproteobacteria bacterium]